MKDEQYLLPFYSIFGPPLDAFRNFKNKSKKEVLYEKYQELKLNNARLPVCSISKASGVGGIKQELFNLLIENLEPIMQQIIDNKEKENCLSYILYNVQSDMGDIITLYFSNEGQTKQVSILFFNSGKGICLYDPQDIENFDLFLNSIHKAVKQEEINLAELGISKATIMPNQAAVICGNG